MTRSEQLPVRAPLLAACAAAAVTGGHLLDALGLLPGVHESATVRASVLAPWFAVLAVAGAAVLAVGVDALLRADRAWSARAALVGGQLALLGAPEVLGRQESGGEQWGALAVAVTLQVLLGTGATAAARALVDRLLRLVRLPSLPRPTSPARRRPAAPAPALQPLAGGLRGRGPPAHVLP